MTGWKRILVRIKVRLFSFFCRLLGKEENRTFFDMEIEGGTTCTDLLAALRIPGNLPKVILINGVVKKEDDILQEGDEVSILPPIEGGCLSL